MIFLAIGKELIGKEEQVDRFGYPLNRLFLKPEVQEWLDEHSINCRTTVFNGAYGDIIFVDNRDAMMFKLRWL